MADKFSRSDVTLANWRTAPHCRWAFQNVREIVPTAAISCLASGQSEMPQVPDGLEVDDPATGSCVNVSTYFEQTEADCFLALKNGKAVTAWCAAHADFDAPHLIFSISKSVTGMLAGIAAEDGALDPEQSVSAYVDLPSSCGFADARVRNLLDMTVAIDFDEEYLDADGAFDRYRRAMLWNPQRPYAEPESLQAVLASFGRARGEHGDRFYYSSPDTDMLGIVIERATGVRYHRYLAERLWQPMGATGAAYVTVDGVGTARAAGGICVTISDLAWFGQLMLDGGRAASGQQIVPAGWVTDMRRNGSVSAWKTGNFADLFENGRYRSCWYSTGDEHDSFCGIGIHGQWVWVDPETGVVIAKTASRGAPSDDAATARDIAVLGQIARRL
ncbi:MAG: serine hydrolase [Rhizobiaceae bacterium]|nr:serine hydrolase [Rhizobiaceae bacterium]